MVVFDSTFLLLATFPNVPVPFDPATRKPWEKGKERIEYLIDRLSDSLSQILVPTPVLAEVLVGAGGAISTYLTKVRGMPGFKVGDFDQRAAVELAHMTASALAAGSKKGAAKTAPWQKVKIDRQIIAIAKVAGATVLYTEDGDLRSLALVEKFTVHNIGDLPLPPVKAQAELALETPTK